MRRRRAPLWAGGSPDRGWNLQYCVHRSLPDVILFEADAVGPLFYFTTRIFDADPGLCVFMDGGKSSHPGLRGFIEKIGLDDQVAFVPTREEADERIRDFGSPDA